MVFPLLRRRASNSAHFTPVSASQARQWRRPAPASNQRSSAIRFFPLGRIRIPNRNSPRITGSTAMCGSCARSQSTTRGSGDGFVGSLKTLASTRYFTEYRSTQIRWEQKNPCADRRAANRWRPRCAEQLDERGDSLRDRDARHRTPDPALSGLFPGILPARQFDPSKRWWFSSRVRYRLTTLLSSCPTAVSSAFEPRLSARQCQYNSKSKYSEPKSRRLPPYSAVEGGQSWSAGNPVTYHDIDAFIPVRE